MRNALLTAGLFVTLAATLATAQLSGAYTIDPAGSGPRNYTTFGAAVTALGGGVSGPVSFTVAPVTFKESISLTPVSGASATNTITFVATGTPATIDANQAQTAIKMADQCAHFVLENLKIVNFAQEGLWLDGQSASNKGVNLCVFKNLVIEAPASSNFRVRPLYLTQSDNNRFIGCVFRGGYYCVYNSQSDKNLYESCEMDAKDTGNYAGYFINNNDSDNVIQNCFFHSVRNSTGAVCLQMQASSFGNMIWNNTIICNTSGAAMKMGGTGWSRSCSLKNNIIVNLGTGIIIDYWFWNTGSTPRNDICECVTDYNCYYCPQNAKYISVKGFSPQTVMFLGDLAGFRAWQKANPGYIAAGGASGYDQNSIHFDPGLVSMVRPFDIHLKSASPCLDAGTSKYPESYQSINQSLTVTQDFEGEARGSKVDIGADEVGISIVGSGSGQIGTTLAFQLTASSDAGLPYQIGSSLGKGPIKLGNRLLELSADQLLVASTSGTLPTIFAGYAGVLDGSGAAKANLNIPKIGGLKGLRIYTAFLTINPSAPLGIQSISTPFLFTVQ